MENEIIDYLIEQLDGSNMDFRYWVDKAKGETDPKTLTHCLARQSEYYRCKLEQESAIKDILLMVHKAKRG